MSVTFTKVVLTGTAAVVLIVGLRGLRSMAKVALEKEQEQQQRLKDEHQQLEQIKWNTLQYILKQDDIILTQIHNSKPVQTPVECLAKNIYYESAWEPYDGKVAVAQVTMNRVADGLGGNNVCSVVYFKKVNPVTHKKEAAFSWTLGSKWRSKGINHKAYKECVKIAREVLHHHLKSNAIGPDVEYYHAVYVHPAWADDHELVATIGQHEFYR